MTIEQAAAKYANDYDGMQWEKDRIEIAFIKGAQSQSREIEELKDKSARWEASWREENRNSIGMLKEIEELKAEIERLKGDADSKAREAFDAARLEAPALHLSTQPLYPTFKDWNNQPN